MSYVLTALGTFTEGRRRRFDPSNKKDLRAFAYYRKHLKWESGCPFYLEWPFVDIVSMCTIKFSDYELSLL